MAAFLLCLAVSMGTAFSMTGDIIQDFLYYSTACQNHANLVWADVDGDGNWDTQIAFITLNGYANVWTSGGGTKYYTFFPQMPGSGGCGYTTSDRARILVRFVDLTAPGIDLGDPDTYLNPNTWTYKSIPFVATHISNDGSVCIGDWGDAYASVNAYEGINQTGIVPGYSLPGLNNTFAHAGGISELYITSDYCENSIEHLYLGELPSMGVVQLFDLSGSMTWSYTGTAGVPPEEQKLAFAKSAALSFMDILNDHVLNNVSVGIADFPRQPWSSCIGEIRRPLSVLNAANYTNITTNVIPSMTASGNTPLLAGAETARTMFGGQSSKSVILLSDGYHNCPSMVDPTDASVTDLISDLVGDDITVYSIGFGKPTDVDHPLLESIASATGGFFTDVTGPSFNPATWDPSTELSAAYAKILSEIIGLDIISDPSAEISAGAVDTHTINVSELDKKLTFLISWVHPQNQYLPVSIIASDGSVIPTQSGGGVTIHHRPTATVVTVAKSYLVSPGRVGATPWRLSVSGQNIPEQKTEKYQYTVLTKSDLHLIVSFNAEAYLTGQVVGITAQVTQGGAPANVGAASQVIVAGPASGVGTWFHSNPISDTVLKAIPSFQSGDHLSMIHRTALAIESQLKKAFPHQIARNPITLKPSIKAAKEKLAATVLNGVSDTLKVDGTYTFWITTQGVTPAGITFTRQARIQKYVSVNPTRESLKPAVSAVGVPSRNIQRYAISVTPRDKYGNYLGPRYRNKIAIKADKGTIAETVNDNVNGSYTCFLDLPVDESIEKVNISVSTGKTNYTTPTKTKNDYSIWLILICIVLGLWIVVLLWKNNRK
jgi:hypothetical protein